MTVSIFSMKYELTSGDGGEERRCHIVVSEDRKATTVEIYWKGPVWEMLS